MLVFPSKNAPVAFFKQAPLAACYQTQNDHEHVENAIPSSVP
jgi:hypothetical protein